MPIYEYECTCCLSQFELKQSFSENTPVSCPRCGGNTVRIFSSVPIIFKGPGFYSTDSRRKENNSSHEDGTDKPKASSSKHEGDTDQAEAGSKEKDS